MNDGESSTSDPEYLPPRKVKKPKRLEKTILELPTKDLMKETASMCVRLKLSQILATSLYAKIILSGGGDLKVDMQFFTGMVSKSNSKQEQ